VLRRVLALVAGALLLAACQVDIDVDLTVEPDGTGTITMTATADGEVVAAVPTIADELVLDDVAAAGWAIDGPVATDDGGLTVTMSHDFVSDQEATNLLRSLGPPFGQMTVQRGTTGDETTTQITGLLGLTNGFQTFADDDLVAAIGSVPFADEIAASGATPETSMTVTLRASLPGEIVDEGTNGTVLDDGTIEWVVPMDDTVDDLRAEATQSPGDDRWWARPLSIVALVALIVWVVFMVCFITYVAIARWRRARDYKHRPRSYEGMHDSLGR
jgi:hypothetical protein